jgi:serine/threonine protein kinase
MIRIKRTYDPPARGDGRRILVERLWPRGMKKEAVAADAWIHRERGIINRDLKPENIRVTAEGRSERVRGVSISDQVMLKVAPGLTKVIPG